MYFHELSLHAHSDHMSPRFHRPAEPGGMHGLLKVTAKISGSVHASTARYLCPDRLHMCLLVFVPFNYTLISFALSGAFSSAKSLAQHNAQVLMGASQS